MTEFKAIASMADEGDAEAHVQGMIDNGVPEDDVYYEHDDELGKYVVYSRKKVVTAHVVGDVDKRDEDIVAEAPTEKGA